jgi:hypothetical protein
MKLCQQLAEAIEAGESILIPKIFEALVNSGYELADAVCRTGD